MPICNNTPDKLVEWQIVKRTVLVLIARNRPPARCFSPTARLPQLSHDQKRRLSALLHSKVVTTAHDSWPLCVFLRARPVPP